MQNNLELKQSIKKHLGNLEAANYFEGIMAFWQSLGYYSQRQPEKQSYSYLEFKTDFDSEDKLKEERALSEDWRQLHLLFQITSDELSDFVQTDFLEEQDFKPHLKSYIFAALELKKDGYSRGAIAEIARQINRCFRVPLIIAFKYGEKLTIAVVGRRQNRRDLNKDVLEKVTLIRDIEFCEPHRAHIEILFELALTQLSGLYAITSFDDLHRAWEKTLDLNELNKKFYQELSNWYFWAIQETEFPDGEEEKRELRNPISIIRLITRMFFVWFMKEKKLIPEALFDSRVIQKILNFKDYNDSTYYKAILQNLFFATLNSEMEIEGKPERRFRSSANNRSGANDDFLIHNYFRYKQYFTEPETIIPKYFQDIPFLNGGLFECLDKEINENKQRKYLRIDGFSDRTDNVLKVPDMLFLDEQERKIDLNPIYGTEGKSYKVKGLLSILNSYKFTVAENTPIEEEVALDPELLGRVFENLLAAYNPETRSTARKETGSFYTPRNIVDYMVDESLIIHIYKALHEQNPDDHADYKLRLQLLFAYADEDHLFTDAECNTIIAAIDNLKAIDPACGSGAFLMGLLLKMVYILHKLDPHNEKWKAQQINRLEEQIKHTKQIYSDYQVRQNIVEQLEASRADIINTFDEYDFDYSRKLFLIENCIYGVDIQPIAIQIAKLRFFLSLLVDEQKRTDRPNLGIRALPNMESKLLAADSLMHLGLDTNREIFEHGLNDFKQELKELQKEYFTARTRKHKRDLREKDAKLRQAFSKKLMSLDAGPTVAEKIALWNPYQTNEYADFLDLGVMFGIDHVNLVIANPPYIRQEDIPNKTEIKASGYKVYNSTSDIYTYFYEQAFRLLDEGGTATFITSNKWMRSKYGEKLRKFFKNETKLLNLIDFGGYQVFGSATVDTNILVFQRAEAALKHKLSYVNIDESYHGESLAEYFYNHQNYIEQTKLEDRGWTLAKQHILALKEKIEKQGKPLKDWNIGIHFGIKTGYNPAFIIDTSTKERLCDEDPKSIEIIKPLLRGRDVKRYRYKWAGKWLILIPTGWTNENRENTEAEEFFQTKYRAIYRFMKEMGDKPSKGKGLYNRDDQGDYWWELRACDYYDEFEKEKIIWPDIAENSSFQIDKNGFYTSNTAYLFTGSNLLYLLGVLNSQIFNFYYKLISSGLGENARRGFKVFIEQFPVASRLDESKMMEITSDAEKLSMASGEKRTQELESKINSLLYEYYGFNEADIKVIEKGGE